MSFVNNLIEQEFKRFKIKHRTTVNDPYGGYISSWTDGAEIDVSFIIGDSDEIIVSNIQSLKQTTTAYFRIDAPVSYNDYIQSVSDSNVVYRIIDDPNSTIPPKTSNLPYKYATVQRTELPS